MSCLNKWNDVYLNKLNELCWFNYCILISAAPLEGLLWRCKRLLHTTIVFQWDGTSSFFIKIFRFEHLLLCLILVFGCIHEAYFYNLQSRRVNAYSKKYQIGNVHVSQRLFINKISQISLHFKRLFKSKCCWNANVFRCSNCYLWRSLLNELEKANLEDWSDNINKFSCAGKNWTQNETELQIFRRWEDLRGSKFWENEKWWKAVSTSRVFNRCFIFSRMLYLLSSPGNKPRENNGGKIKTVRFAQRDSLLLRNSIFVKTQTQPCRKVSADAKWSGRSRFTAKRSRQYQIIRLWSWHILQERVA